MEFACKDDRTDANELKTEDKLGNVVWTGPTSDDPFWPVVVAAATEELKARLRLMDV